MGSDRIPYTRPLGGYLVGIDFVVDLIIIIYQILHVREPPMKDKIHFDSLTRLIEEKNQPRIKMVPPFSSELIDV